MVSTATGIGVAAIVAFIALYKGRTWWHWFVFGIFAFAAAWVAAMAGLYLAGVHPSLDHADHNLAAFTGMLTGLVLVVVLLAVPHRPKRSTSANR